MKRLSVLLVVLLLLAQLGQAQELKQIHSRHVSCPVCYASDKVEKARIPPPIEFLLKSGEKKCTITVDYVNFPEDAKVAFQYAVEIWESILESDHPIRMKAEWRRLSEGVLGSCGPETYYANFRNAPYKDKYYAVAIAEKISGMELNGESRYDLEANFSNQIDWYYGTDLNTPDDKYDLVSVVLHEICHGLGFTGFFFVNEEQNTGGYGFYDIGNATSFDELVVKGTGSAKEQLIDTSLYENPSTVMKRALESFNLFSESPVAMARNNNNMPKLYAPFTFDGGSSIYHLNDISYPNGNENSLMTHAVGRGEAIHDPGPLARGIMDDIGWRNIYINFDRPKDMEELQPVDFEVRFDSYYDVADSSAKVVYSYDGFNEHSDTLLLENNEADIYSATLNIEEGNDSVLYYVCVSDTLGRPWTSPATVPKEYYSIVIGVDTEKPILSHDPIPYFVKMGQDLKLTLEASDNLGLDTVFVEYSLNDVQQAPFGLQHEYSDVYSGIVPIDQDELSDGDIIKYQFKAIDKAANPNSAQLPESGDLFSFRIEEIFDPVNSYANDFNGETSDFLLSDFDIYTEADFENGALHSPHPYPSPNIDNQDFDFTTFLKKPIILKEEGKMTFDEIALVEPGAFLSKYGDDDFFDYVIVEGSKDMGKTWLEIADGYDATYRTSWSETYDSDIVGNDSKALGTPELYVNREVDLLRSGNFAAGDTILVRFRLYSDPYANGWGWAIDNLFIQFTVDAPLSELSPGDVAVYPNPFSDKITVRVDALSNAANIRIEVYNMYGQSVYMHQEESSFGKLQKEIDLSGLNAGMFLVKVSENGQAVLTKKLIKN